MENPLNYTSQGYVNDQLSKYSLYTQISKGYIRLVRLAEGKRVTKSVCAYASFELQVQCYFDVRKNRARSNFKPRVFFERGISVVCVVTYFIHVCVLGLTKQVRILYTFLLFL